MCWELVTSKGKSPYVITGEAPVNKAKEPVALQSRLVVTMEVNCVLTHGAWLALVKNFNFSIVARINIFSFSY